MRAKTGGKRTPIGEGSHQILWPRRVPALWARASNWESDCRKALPRAGALKAYLCFFGDNKVSTVCNVASLSQ